jgi:heme/copper-type cytochrome/quinol oxidase subunit 2
MGRAILRCCRAAVVAAAMMSPHSVAADQPVHDVQIVATRNAFEPATIQVTAGELVRLVIRSKDVVHGFSIPNLNIDVRIPAGGEPITVEFAAPPPGQYDIACSEFCGGGHGQMKASLVSVASTGSPTTAPAMSGAAGVGSDCVADTR